MEDPRERDNSGHYMFTVARVRAQRELGDGLPVRRVPLPEIDPQTYSQDLFRATVMSVEEQEREEQERKAKAELGKKHLDVLFTDISRVTVPYEQFFQELALTTHRIVHPKKKPFSLQYDVPSDISESGVGTGNGYPFQLTYETKKVGEDVLFVPTRYTQFLEPDSQRKLDDAKLLIDFKDGAISRVAVMDWKGFQAGIRGYNGGTPSLVREDLPFITQDMYSNEWRGLGYHEDLGIALLLPAEGILPELQILTAKEKKIIDMYRNYGYCPKDWNEKKYRRKSTFEKPKKFRVYPFDVDENAFVYDSGQSVTNKDGRGPQKTQLPEIDYIGVLRFLLALVPTKS